MRTNKSIKKLIIEINEILKEGNTKLFKSLLYLSMLQKLDIYIYIYIYSLCVKFANLQQHKTILSEMVDIKKNV